MSSKSARQANKRLIPIKAMSADDMARTSNEWMRRYIEEPEQFAAEFQSVTEFLTDVTLGREPTYGERCAAYQFKLLDEMTEPA
jgi:hypothetical protein